VREGGILDRALRLEGGHRSHYRKEDENGAEAPRES
jgi:hypothetical protein